MRAAIESSTHETRADENAAPLVAHVIYRLDIGGLENGLVNLINRIPADRYRHAIICLTDHSNFRDRLQRPDVPVYSLHKPPGRSFSMHLKLWRLLKELRPRIVHTRNLPTVEAALTAATAGVPVRIHGEHGRDVGDLTGNNRWYRFWRAMFRPFVHEYVALSRELECYLRERIGVPSERITHLHNGVDTETFRPARGGREPLPIAGFASADAFVIGTVGRMEAVKDPLNLARAFVMLTSMIPAGGRPVRLVMAGDGALRSQVNDVLRQAGVGESVWLAGERSDVAELMRGFDVFALPSLGEGISNTVLEAMASGLPVVATAVGGNPELVRDGRTGRLVPSADPRALAEALLFYYHNEAECRRQGSEARLTVERHFSMQAMVGNYVALYDRMLKKRGAPGSTRSCAES